MPRRLDASTSPDIVKICQDHLKVRPYLILDCSELLFLTSAGLATFAQISREADNLGGAVHIAACTKDSLQVIKSSGFGRAWPLFDSVNEAKKG